MAMRIQQAHHWVSDPKEAVALQRILVSRIVPRGSPRAVRYIAGADVSTDPDTNLAHAGVVILTYPGLEVIERRRVTLEIHFPYIPGLLAFREGPALLKAFEQVRREPDLILFDGQGIAHPRGLGIASHVGLLLDKPSIGCAKSLLYGKYEDPAAERGAFSDLRASRGRVIGAVLRTRSGVRPIYVSVGHRIGLPDAIKFVLASCPRYRIPEPIRHAHRFVNEVRRSYGVSTGPEGFGPGG